MTGPIELGATTRGESEPTAQELAGKHRRLDVGSQLQAGALLIAWLGVSVALAIATPSNFLTTANLANILGSQAVPFILTLSLLLPLTCGDYDLSVAAVATLSSMTTAIFNVNDHWPIVAALALSIVIGAFVGVVNAAIILAFNVDSLIVTLGSATFLQGLILWISNSATISGISTGLVNVVIADKFLTVPLAFYYALALCFLVWFVQQHTALGKRMLFVGRGRSVARLSGLRVPPIRFGALVASAVIASLAGVVYAGTTGSADPSSGLTYLLPAFAAAFLGTTAVKPGRFNAWGAFIAVYFLATGITGLQLLGAASFVQQLFYGAALMVAVSLAQVAGRRRVNAE